MPVVHEPWLVALSIAVAIQGAYVGLSLAVQVGEAAGVRRRLLLAGSALSLAVAIWAMHFVGMLAVRLPFPIDYLVLPTLLSFLVCVIVVGAAVFAASAGPPTPLRLTAAATFMGLGIASMHYLGMSALHASAHMHHAPLLVAASVVFAIAASGLALFLAGGRSGRPPLILSAIALGFAIAGMHYTAMTGLTVMPRAETMPGAPALSTDLLAIVVAVVAFGVSGIFLLALVPDRKAQRAATTDTAVEAGSSAVALASVASPASAISTPESAELEPGAHPLAAALSDSGAEAQASAVPHALPARLLPVVREGMTQFVAVRDIVAVHANAHYTTVFDGTSKLFCPLPIGEVEARLGHAHFARVHRSHIVNLERVVGLKRNGDHGLIELSGHDSYTVPVSRSRFGDLKSQLGLGPREAVT
jgi:NO-binding membrane sensor protein with MHYT domain/DNA-binding LytR/AlgR family response regulator